MYECAPASLPSTFQGSNLCMRLGCYFIRCLYLSPCSLNSELSQSFKWFENRFVHLYRNQDIRHEVRTIVAKCLSVRLLILQNVFSVGGVCPQLLSHFRNAIKCPVYKKYCVLLSKFIISSAIVALVVSLLQCQNGRNGD